MIQYVHAVYQVPGTCFESEHSRATYDIQQTWLGRISRQASEIIQSPDGPSPKYWEPSEHIREFGYFQSNFVKFE